MLKVFIWELLKGPAGGANSDITLPLVLEEKCSKAAWSWSQCMCSQLSTTNTVTHRSLKHSRCLSNLFFFCVCVTNTLIYDLFQSLSSMSASWFQDCVTRMWGSLGARGGGGEGCVCVCVWNVCKSSSVGNETEAVKRESTTGVFSLNYSSYFIRL